jgi:outer membrane protein OmpA-like peptidoglycan-associated protein/tetratricopeptide (TPR) repeat protein
MNKNFIAGLLVLGLSLSVNAQEGLIVSANKLYDQRAYAEAIPKYEKVLKKDSSNALILSKLGDCYRLTNNAKGQVTCYGKLADKGLAEMPQRLYLGQALMELGRYDEAKKVLGEYQSDERGAVLSKSIENLVKYSKNADAYRVDTVNFNSQENDFCPVFFVEGKVVFTSARKKISWIRREHGWTGNSYYNLYTTERGSDGKYWKPEKFMRDLESKYNDGPICFSADKHTVYFTRNNVSKKGKAIDGTYKLKIYSANLNIDGFEMVKELPFNSNQYNCAHPSLSPDGKTLYFVSDMGGGQGGLDIWYSKLGDDGAWGTPVNMGEKVNTKGHEMFPYAATDNMLYFSSNGLDGIGGLDIYEVKKKTDGSWGKVYNMGIPINSQNDDFGIIFSDETMKSGFLSSNRKRGGQDDDIYSFLVLRDVKRGKEVLIKTLHKDSSSVPVAYAKVKINNDSITTNQGGEYTYFIEEDTYYNLKASREKYFEVADSLSTKMSDKDEFTKELLLERDPELSLVGFVLDAKTKEALKDVKISIKNVNGTEFDNATIYSASDGYRKALPTNRIGDKLDLKIKIEKPGYVTKDVDFSYTIKKPGEIKMNEAINMDIGKVMVGMDLAKMIDIKPIYFDLGKSKITAQAAKELDKVVAVMKEYPGMTVELGSHTDCRAAAKANMALSMARAKASAGYIASKGIPRTRITGKGYGESKLLNGCACEGKLVSNCTEDDHALNRRTEFIITKYKEIVPKK